MARLINAEAYDLDFQFKNIFEAAAIEAGESIPDNASVDVFALIKNILKSLDHKILQKELNIQILLEDTSKEGECFNTDPEKLSLIILNLLSNAIKFNKLGGNIILSVRFKDGYLHLTVEDNGAGIRKSDENQIFNRFKKMGALNTYGGYGLGLSVVKSLAETLNGTVELVSKKTPGTIISVTLPEFPALDELQDFSQNGNEVFFSPQTRF